jgi:hypothetical protein
MYDGKITNGKLKYDNKIRLSPDVLEKAEQIAQEWGLKNARAAVEAVFRKYADEYLERRSPVSGGVDSELEEIGNSLGSALPRVANPRQPAYTSEALSALDELLGL